MLELSLNNCPILTTNIKIPCCDFGDDYKFDNQGNISSYTENYTPNFDLPYRKIVALRYDYCR
jgi:hypothetical protein